MPYYSIHYLVDTSGGAATWRQSIAYLWSSSLVLDTVFIKILVNLNSTRKPGTSSTVWHNAKSVMRRRELLIQCKTSALCIDE
eukprot:1443942-Pleurochrysis_carterae.AAC.2